MEVEILKGQESFRIKSFVKSNIWALLPAGKSKFKKGEIVKLEIIDYAFVGKGISKLIVDGRDYIIFIQHGIKGQIVNAKITKRKPNYAEGIIIDILEMQIFSYLRVP